MTGYVTSYEEVLGLLLRAEKLLVAHQHVRDNHFEDYACPECGMGSTNGHYPDCEIAKLLKDMAPYYEEE
ncbi:zinc ribbon 14 domain-containing protein [Pseudomonas phage EM]|uniref:Zinc ribbon 14 domain-containing protein n=1 Tax=Pseudomonas phage EM TaxID=2936914 RepID=A0AAE9KSR1_9CAUD|nr:zinc ribbon 14 domain-containing protein [Pseudomonas phage EM]UPW35852.1 zinc ribbon 14 domain-containing protein [Pseudomonas phage EM]